MIATSTLTGKNQTTIPKLVVMALGVKPADKLVFEIEDGVVRLSAKTGTFPSLLRALPKVPGPKRPVTIEAMKKSVAQRAIERFRKSRRGTR